MDIFDQPSDEKVKIWRYMDFTKFISLIDSSRLFFASADSFEDSFEGSWTTKDLELRKQALASLSSPKPNLEETKKQMDLLFKFLPRRVGITCWHENNHESAAMWKLYLKTNEGIAIQTTYELLKKSFKDASKLQFGKVNYVDFENDATSLDILNRPLLRTFALKRKSFEHEKEIRGLYFEELADYREMDKGIGPGVSFEVDLSVLIQKIYISPTAPGWFVNLVVNCFQKYGHDFQCQKSNLYLDPLF